MGSSARRRSCIVSALPLRLAPLSTGIVESSLSAFNTITMASGELPTEFKFFHYLIQAVVASLTLTIKPLGGDNDLNKIDQAVELMKTSLDE
jgi:hypothetical protein